MVSTILRFVSSLLLGLAAFYLVARGMFWLGRVDAYTFSEVEGFYAMIFRPVSNLSPAVQRTLLSIAAVCVLQLALLHRMFKQWAYRPCEETAPLMDTIRSADWSDRPLHTAAAVDNRAGADALETKAIAAQLPKDEYHRLLSLLRKGE